MLKLSNTTRNAAMAAVLGTGLVGSAVTLLAPVAAHAQWGDMDGRGVHRDWDDRGFHRDWDDRGFHRDWDDRFHAGVGFGFYGAPYYYPYYSGYSYDPYYYDYGPYCSSYDYYYGYCSY